MVEHMLHFNFSTTNNQDEYKAVIARLKLAKDNGIQSLLARNNSQLVISKVNGTYEIKELYLNKYVGKVKDLLKTFNQYELEII